MTCYKRVKFHSKGFNTFRDFWRGALCAPRPKKAQKLKKSPDRIGLGDKNIKQEKMRVESNSFKYGHQLTLFVRIDSTIKDKLRLQKLTTKSFQIVAWSRNVEAILRLVVLRGSGFFVTEYCKLLFNKLSLCPYMVRKPSISVIRT